MPASSGGEDPRFTTTSPPAAIIAPPRIPDTDPIERSL